MGEESIIKDDIHDRYIYSDILKHCGYDSRIFITNHLWTIVGYQYIITVPYLKGLCIL